MENQNQISETKTIAKILWQKVLSFFEENNLRDLARLVGTHLIVVILTLALTRPLIVAEWIGRILSAGSFVVPKFALCSLIVWKFGWLRKTAQRVAWRSEQATIEGIPSSELLHHLFTEGSLKFEARRKFGMSSPRFTALVKKLEEVGVLIRDDNNARVLNPEKSREQVADILRGKNLAAELSPHLAIHYFGEEIKKDAETKERLVEIELEDEKEITIPVRRGAFLSRSIA